MDIKELVFSFVIICVCARLIEIMIPEKSEKLKKYVKYLLALCVISAIISPLFSVFSHLGSYDINFPEGEDIDDGKIATEIIKSTVENIKASVKNMLCMKYGIENEDISIEIFVDDSDISSVEISKIFVELKKINDSYKANDIKNHLKKTFFCEISVKNALE